jgi:N-acetylmuramoyl-L-alanine amidase
VTLGIEMCVVDFAGNFTVQTSDAAAELAADICTRHHLNPFADVATHNMVCGYKDCPRLWVNHPELLGEFLANVASAIAKRG